MGNRKLVRQGLQDEPFVWTADFESSGRLAELRRSRKPEALSEARLISGTALSEGLQEDQSSGGDWGVAELNSPRDISFATCLDQPRRLTS